jgi:nucleoside-diphosphate-sugar epimerase
MKTVLVTGASGFTGGYVCRRLNNDGFKVKALILPGIDTRDYAEQGIRPIIGDLRERATLEDAVSGVDTIYHIAAVYREENIPRKTFWDVNVEGTRNLLETALEHKIKRFVHCSTVGVQGEIKDPPATEEAPYRPGDYYQQSKLEGELLALSYFHEKGLPGVVFRPVGIYGPGDTRFQKLFRYIADGKFRMFGSGKVLYHLTYIDDLVDGICLVGEKPGIEGEIITLAGDKYTTLNELVETIADVLNVQLSKMHYPVWPLWAAGAVCELLCQPFKINPPIYRRRVEFFVKDRAFDITKARKLLGYNPQVDLRTGLKKTADWYKSQGLLS